MTIYKTSGETLLQFTFLTIVYYQLFCIHSYRHSDTTLVQSNFMSVVARYKVINQQCKSCKLSYHLKSE